MRSVYYGGLHTGILGIQHTLLHHGRTQTTEMLSISDSFERTAKNSWNFSGSEFIFLRTVAIKRITACSLDLEKKVISASFSSEIIFLASKLVIILLGLAKKRANIVISGHVVITV